MKVFEHKEVILLKACGRKLPEGTHVWAMLIPNNQFYLVDKPEGITAFLINAKEGVDFDWIGPRPNVPQFKQGDSLGEWIPV